MLHHVSAEQEIVGQVMNGRGERQVHGQHPGGEEGDMLGLDGLGTTQAVSQASDAEQIGAL